MASKSTPNTSNEDVIELMFEVAGKGEIDDGAGENIKNQLQHMMDNLYKKTDIFKLKFEIDKKSFEAQLKKLAKTTVNLNSLASGKSGNSGAGGEEAEGQEEVNNAYKQGEKIIKDYFSLQQRNYKNQRNGVTISKTLADAYKKASEEYAKWYKGFKEGGDLEEDERAKLQALIDTQEREYKILQEKGADQEARSMERLADSYEKNRAKLSGLLDQRKGLRHLNKETEEWFERMWEMANTPWKFPTLKGALTEIQEYCDRGGESFQGFKEEITALFNEGITEENLAAFEGKHSVLDTTSIKKSLSKSVSNDLFTDLYSGLSKAIDQAKIKQEDYNKRVSESVALVQSWTTAIANPAYYASIKESSLDLIAENDQVAAMFKELDTVMADPHPAVSRVQEVLDKYQGVFNESERIKSLFAQVDEELAKGGVAGLAANVGKIEGEFADLSGNKDIQNFFTELKSLSNGSLIEMADIEPLVAKYRNAFSGIDQIVTTLTKMQTLTAGTPIADSHVFSTREYNELVAVFSTMDIKTEGVKEKVEAFEDLLWNDVGGEKFKQAIEDVLSMLEGPELEKATAAFNNITSGESLKSENRIFTIGDLRDFEEQCSKAGSISDTLYSKILQLQNQVGKKISGDGFKSVADSIDNLFVNSDNLRKTFDDLYNIMGGEEKINVSALAYDFSTGNANDYVDTMKELGERTQALAEASDLLFYYQDRLKNTTDQSDRDFLTQRIEEQTKVVEDLTPKVKALDDKIKGLKASEAALEEVSQHRASYSVDSQQIAAIDNLLSSNEFKQLATVNPKLEEFSSEIYSILSDENGDFTKLPSVIVKYRKDIEDLGLIIDSSIVNPLNNLQNINIRTSTQIFTRDDFDWIKKQCQEAGDATGILGDKLDELRQKMGERLNPENIGDSNAITDYINALKEDLSGLERANELFNLVSTNPNFLSAGDTALRTKIESREEEGGYGDLITHNSVVRQFYGELLDLQRQGGEISQDVVQGIIDKYKTVFSQMDTMRAGLEELQTTGRMASTGQAYALFGDQDLEKIEASIQKLGLDEEKTTELLAKFQGQLNKPLNSEEFRELADELSTLYRETGRYEDLYNELSKMASEPFTIERYNAFKEEFSDLAIADEQVQGVFLNLDEKLATPIDSKVFDNVITDIESTGENLDKFKPQIDKIKKAFEDKEINFTSLDKIDELLGEFVGDAAEATEMANMFRAALSKNVDLSGAQEAVKGMKDAGIEASRITAELSAETDTFFNKIKNAFGTNLVQKMSSMVMMTLTKSVKQIYTNIKDLDSALAQLRIVTKDASVSSQEFADTISNVAIKTATSVSSMVESVTTYARLGYSLNEATQLAELTAEYSKVAAVDVSDATTNITGIIKAFDISVSQLESVLDKMITVGNNFAISSAELGEGLNNAAAALAANGNSLEESLGILAAANSTIQDVSRSSTAVRTVAARISNSTSELEELGEDTTDLISTAALADEMEAFGVQIVNANGDLLSTYDILSQVAAQWDSYSNTAQASIAKLLAGTRQQAVFYSMIQNWDDAEAAVEACGDAGGELADSYAIYTDTIEGKINQLSASWEKFSDNLLNSEGIKFLVDIVRGLLSALNFLAPALKKMGTVFVALFALIAEAIAKSITKPASEAKNEIKQLNAEMNQLEAKGKKKGGGLGSMFTSFGSAFKVFKGQAKETEQTAKNLQKTTVNTSTGGLNGSPMSNSDSANMAENQEKTAAASAESAESMSKMYNSVLMVTSITSTLLDSIFSAADVTEHWGDLISAMVPLLGAIVVLVNLIKNGLNATGVIALIAMLAMAVTSLVSAISNWETQDQIRMKKLKEELEDNISLLEEYEDKLEDINDEYEELIERVEELQKKSANGTMTAAEADELKNTKERLGLLEQEKEISEKTVARQQEITADTANKYVEGLNSTTYSYKKATGLKKKNSDFMTSMKAIGQAGSHTTTEWISLMAQYYDLLNSEERDWLAEQIDELETYADALDPTDEAYSEIRKVLDQYTLAISDTGWEKTFSNIIERDEFSDAKNYIYTIGTLNTELENETAKMEETLKDMSESEIDEYIEKYAAKMGIVGDDLEQLTNDVKHAQSVLQGLTEEQMQTAADALGMDVADFAEEMCDLTVEQIQIVANALDMSIEALQEIINGLTEDMIDTCGDVLGYDISSLEKTIEEATSDLENNAAMQDLISYLQDVGLLGAMDQSYIEWQRETLEKEARRTLDAEVAQYLAEGSKSVGDYEYQLNGYNTANAGAALDKFLKSEGYDTSTYKKFTDAYEEYATEYVNNLLAEFDELYTEDMSMMDYLINTILSYGNSYEATIYTQSYASMLADADDAFDKISSALDDISDSGIVSSSTIQDLLEDYKDLVDEYFEFTEEGYKLKDAWADMSSLEILEDYAKGQIESYIDVAVEAQDALDKAKELRNQLDEVGEAYNEEGELITKYDKETGQLTQEYLDALEAVYIAELDVENAGTNIERIAAAMATEIRESVLDEMTDELQAQVDALEDQLDAYQDLIDLRKELLQSYKDEIDYQKELASKTSNVADLETQLAIAKLDNSAAGQARQRELQSQLDSAQEELDDYTLENAVDRVTNQLEKEGDEFERIIDKQTEDLEDKMDEIAKNLKVTINYLYGEEDEDGNRPIIGIDSITTSYHHGGFVGGEIRGNEEFAKLLKGEFVATPAMMQNFMEDTLPGIAQAAEDGAGKGGNVFNSPLISLTCEGITTEAIPDVEKIVKKATEEIKKQFDAGFSRAGRNTRSLNLSL